MNPHDMEKLGTDLAKAFKPMQEAFGALTAAITEFIETPGVREALAKHARLSAMELREEADALEVRAEPEPRDGLFQDLAKGIWRRQALKCRERADELTEAAEVFAPND
jgi:hypothetical protein